MARRKQQPENNIYYLRPTVPVFHFPTAHRPQVYTLADGGVIGIRQREFTWRYGYIYYVDVLTRSWSTGKHLSVFTERELMLFMGMLTVSKQGKVA